MARSEDEGVESGWSRGHLHLEVQRLMCRPPARGGQQEGETRKAGQRGQGFCSRSSRSALGWRAELGTEVRSHPDQVHCTFFVINMMDLRMVMGKETLLEKLPAPMSGVRGPEGARGFLARLRRSQGQFHRLCSMERCYATWENVINSTEGGGEHVGPIPSCVSQPPAQSRADSVTSETVPLSPSVP